MSKIESINPDRILWCCDDYDVDVSELPKLINMSANRFAKLMSGSGSITYNQLNKLAKALNKGILFFLDDKPVRRDTIHSAQFRTLTNQKPHLSQNIKALIERVEKHRDIFIELCDELDLNEQLLNFSPPNIPSDTSAAAEAIRNWLDLHYENDFNSYRNAVENKGVMVILSNGYHGQWKVNKDSNIRGFSLWHNRLPAIFITKQYNQKVQSFTLMHELAHIILHKKSYVDDESDFYKYQGVEKSANELAGNILVPDEFLNSINYQNIDLENVASYNDSLKPYSNRWGVSVEVILRRLLSKNVIHAQQYNNYRDWLKTISITKKNSGNRQYRYREPKHIFGDKYVKVILDAMSDKSITMNKASSYLDNIKYKDLMQLEEFYA